MDDPGRDDPLMGEGEPAPPQRNKGLDGFERRANARAPLNMLCEIDIPGLPIMFKAMIVDLSAGGMRLRIPKVAIEHLAQSFLVQWPMGGIKVRAPVYMLYHPTDNEIVVRFLKIGPTLSGQITRYVYLVLKTKQQGGKLYDPPAPVDSQAPLARRERRMRMMKNQQQTLMDALIESKNMHHSRTNRWLAKRVVTHLMEE
jgi:hypothetical protein